MLVGVLGRRRDRTGPDDPPGALIVVDHVQLNAVLSDYARLLVKEYEVSDALHNLVDGAARVLGIAGAGVSVVRDDRLEFATASPEKIAMLERVQDESGAGPCVAAHRSGDPVLIPDLAASAARWPAVADAALQVGLASAAGIPMRLNGNRIGVLNLYDDRPREWSDEEVSAARLLADMATGYAVNAARLDHYRHTAEQLQAALDSRVVIEQAKGILAGERAISVDQAFGVLRDHARRQQAPLRAVADAVVSLGLRP